MNTQLTNCGHCHACGTPLKSVLDGEEWCPVCQQYRRYQSHGWAADTADTDSGCCPARLPVHVERVDTLPEQDPYHRDTLTTTQTTLVLDPEHRSVAVEQDADVGGVTPDRYYQLLVTQDIETRPDADALRTYLAGSEGQALLARVCDGHERIWNGENVIGRLSDDAGEALADLASAIARLPETEWTLWDTAEWLDASLPDVRTLTDEQVEALTAELDACAERDHIILSVPVADYLADLRSR